jgi:hypothetical protein
MCSCLADGVQTGMTMNACSEPTAAENHLVTGRGFPATSTAPAI